MSWYIVMICGAVGGVFLGFCFGALAGLWIMGDGAPEDCPAAHRKPKREEPPEPEGKERAAGEPAEHAPAGNGAPVAAGNTMNTGNTGPAASAAGKEERPRK